MTDNAMTTEDFQTPASPAPPGDAGLDGAEVGSSLAPPPGGYPRPDARGTAGPSRTPLRGGPVQAPDRGVPEGSAPRSGQAPGGGDAITPAPSPGAQARQAVRRRRE